MGKGKLGIVAVSSFVVANMIGTGVFTSLGFQLLDISNLWAVLLLWLLGGFLAFCGALVYAELGSVMPRSGGEYNFLSQIYHPSIGFMAGWISITVGFAAPIAAASMAMGSYLASAFSVVNAEVVAIVTLVVITVIHSFTIDLAGKWQTVITFVKLALIVVFIGAGFLLLDAPANNFNEGGFIFEELMSAPYAVALVWVMFAYSGWNSATYILGDIKNPKKTIAPALLISTALVAILYVLLNFIFLYAAPVSQLEGQIEIGNIAAVNIFGESGGRIMSGVISILLISSISSMVYVGARVMQPMGEDAKLLKPLSKVNKAKVPTIALWIQCIIALGFILTASFSQIIIYSGFVLNLCTMLATLGLFIHRFKNPNMERPFKAWGYPVLPGIFLLAMLWILIFLIVKQPVESLYGALTAGLGIVIYFVNKKIYSK